MLSKDDKEANVILENIVTKVKLYLAASNILLPREILENVPKIHEQEGIDDKVVYAIYYIPKKNRLWIMTEYDKETHEAYGMIVGVENEWGYFSLDELKAIGAKRYVFEEFPKVYSKIDIELLREHVLNLNKLLTDFWLSYLEILKEDY